MVASEDAAAFQSRIRYCIGRSGSIYALAKRIGVFPNTIRGYLKRSEPTRPHLVAIARECQVSVEWLATGTSRVPDDFEVLSSDPQLASSSG